MPSTYTLNNGIELIATGEQSGTWGDTTNVNFSLIDTALDGQVTITLDSAGSSGSPNSLEITDGSSSSGRNRMLIFTDGGDLGASAFVQLTPNDAEKIFYVRNNLSGNRALVLFQGTYNAANDYEVPAGTTAVVFFNGGGAGAVAANVFNNAHFDSLNVVGNATVTGTATLASVDINGGTIDGAVIGGTTPAAISGTTGTFSGDFAVDTSVLFVDVSTNRVGVNTNAPTQAFDVSGNVQIRSSQPTLLLNDIDSTEDNKITAINSPSGELAFQYRDDALAGGGDYIRFPRSDNQMLGMEFLDAAVVKNFISTSGDSYFTSGNVGIGTTNPQRALDVFEDTANVARVSNGSSGGTPSTTHGEFVVESDEANLGIQLLGTATSNQRILFGDPDSAGVGQVTYDHTNNYMTFVTSNSERVRIDSSGNVGIGLTSGLEGSLSTADYLQVRRNTDGWLLKHQRTDNSQQAGIYASGHVGAVGLDFYTNNTNRMTLGANGDVTIRGQSTETKQLNIGVGRSGSGSSLIDLVGDTTYTDYGTRLIREGGANAPTRLIHRGTSSLFLTTSEASSIAFQTDDTTRMSIGATGNVSINGQSTEVKELNIGVGRSGDGSSLIDLVGDTTYTGYGARLVRYGGANAATQLLHRGTANLTLTASDAASITFQTDSTTRVTINSAGNVGIGTTAPVDTLDVAGGIRSSLGITRVGDNTSDGVKFVVGRYAPSVPYLSVSTAGTNTRMEIGTADSRELRFTGGGNINFSNSGNVGIGTTSAAAKLEVAGTVKATGLNLNGTAITATAAEINRLGGVTSNIQTQLNGKAATTTTISAGAGLTGGGSLAANRTISHADTSSQGSVNNSGATVIQDVTLDAYGHVTGLGSATISLSTLGVTATAAELNKLDGVTATTAELNYVDGVTSNIQTQLNGKASTSTQTTAAWQAGSSTTETIVSPAKVSAAIEAQAIGVGQQWYNDGSIVSGTAYTNSLGRPVQVMVSFNGAGSKTLGLSHNGTTWVETLNLDNDGSDHDVNASFIVPPGHRWRVVGGWTFSRRLTLR